MQSIKLKSTFKALFIYSVFLFAGECFSQYTGTFRIQEISTNPNCSGSYIIKENGSGVSPIIMYSYPSQFNRILPDNPPPYCYPTATPDEVEFINIDSCSNTSFVVPLNGQAVIQSCKCLGPPAANHNFSATIEPDTSGPCDFLIKVFY
jgi:hypothetical protein